MNYDSYFEAMFFGEHELEDSKLSILDIDKDSYERVIGDIELFLEKAQPILDETDYTHDQALHDFYFTRQGHGVGFWEADHCSKDQGEELTKLAKEFGGFDVYTKNGTIYIY